MAVSTIPAFKAALRDRLETLFAGTSVQVSYGHPYPEYEDGELVIVGKADRNPGQEPLTFPLALGQRSEDYTVDVIVSVVGSAQDPHETFETRAYEIAASIEDDLLDWKDTAFGGTVISALVSGMTDGESLTPSGQTREATVTIAVDVSALV